MIGWSVQVCDLTVRIWRQLSFWKFPYPFLKWFFEQQAVWKDFDAAHQQCGWTWCLYNVPSLSWPVGAKVVVRKGNSGLSDHGDGFRVLDSSVQVCNRYVTSAVTKAKHLPWCYNTDPVCLLRDTTYHFLLCIYLFFTTFFWHTHMVLLKDFVKKKHRSVCPYPYV